MKTLFSLRRLFQVCGVSACFVLPSVASANQVAARLEGSLLVIQGDNLANQIIVSQSANRDVIVRGQNGTRVNGRDQVVFRQPALEQAEIRMGGGNDIVTFSNFSVSNDLYVNLGAGADQVRTGTLPSSVGFNATIEGGTGTDSVAMRGWQVGGDLYVDGQTDSLRMTLANMTVLGAMTVIGDAAADSVALTGCSTGLDTSIELGAGADSVTIQDFVGFSLWVTTNEGADRVELTSVTTLEDLGIFSGTENDVVTLAEVAAGKNVFVGTDAGADRVTAAAVSAEYDAVFEGGAAVDSLTNLGILGGVKVEIKEFEIFP